MAELMRTKTRVVCGECDKESTVVLSYTVHKPAHVLHAILTIITFFWILIWVYVVGDCHKKNQAARRLSVHGHTCKHCGWEDLMEIT